MQLKEFLMTAEAWTIIGTGIAILVAIAASNRSIRAELSELRANLLRLDDRMNQLEVRLGRVEGTLDVIRDSMFGRHDVA